MTFSNRCTRLLSLAAGVCLAVAAISGPLRAETKDHLTLAMSIEPSGLDPTVAAPVAIGQVVWQNVFQGLTRIDENGAVLPQLAREWTVSDDGLTVTFHLRDDARFQNGVAFDSKTAKFTLDRARGDASTNPQKQFFQIIDSVEMPDAATLVLRLKERSANLLYWLAWPAAVMVEPGTADTNRAQPVGTGPFRVVEWRAGDRVRMERVDDYWDKDALPPLRSAEFRFIKDAQAQAAAIRSQTVDAIPEFGAPELYKTFEGSPQLSTVVGHTELKVVAGMNLRRKPFDDPRVRRALMMAVDRAGLVEAAWSGYGEPIGSHYTPNDPGYIDLTAKVPYDPHAARALLTEAGYPEGFTATIRSPQMSYATRSSEILQGFLAEIGVTLDIVPTDFPAVWVDQVLKGHDFDMTIVAHAEPLDIGIYARPDYYFGYRSPAFDAANAQAETAPDDAARLAAYGRAQEILAEDLPALYLFAMPKLGLWDRRVKGLWTNEPIPANDLTEVRWVE